MASLSNADSIKARGFFRPIRFHAESGLFGLIPSTTYKGFYYSEDDEPHGFQDVPVEFVKSGNGWSWAESEGEIRKNLIEEGLIDCIVNLPAKLFLNTQIPAALWFMRRKKVPNPKYRNTENEILFIDARNLGHLINRRNRELSKDDIDLIASTYHNWRNVDGQYEDVAGFCASVPVSKVAELDYVLTPGRYVGLPDEEDDFNFVERFTSLKATLEEQLAKEAELNAIIAENLSKIELPKE
jgi:type I restriction enzyme M protein